jgi:hypothetical protein
MSRILGNKSVAAKLLHILSKETSMALAADGAAVMLLASGFSYLFFTLTKLEVSLGSAIGISITCTIVNILLSRRWWIPPALMLAGLAAGIIVYLRLDSPRETLESLVSAARLAWWILTGYTAPTLSGYVSGC